MIGEETLGSTVPNMMRGLDCADGRIRIFGRTATRDFTYVGDIVNGLLACATTDKAVGEAINLATA